MKINIGCGFKHLKGFINIDKAEECFPDRIVNVEEGLPFPNNSVNYIYSSHAIEHIEPQYWRFFLSELYRVAKNGCILELWLPFDNPSTRTNPDHFRTFSWRSFDIFTDVSGREYFSPLYLKSLTKIPNRFVRMFYWTFPFLKRDIYFKFKIVKNSKKRITKTKEDIEKEEVEIEDRIKEHLERDKFKVNLWKIITNKENEEKGK
jgi:ubiquinone/menaquinone biosynthesis C-methylase UbiE